ncbi:unnamed protein product, partial [Symbiodinium sp. KB8]
MARSIVSSTSDQKDLTLSTVQLRIGDGHKLQTSVRKRALLNCFWMSSILTATVATIVGAIALSSFASYTSRRHTEISAARHTLFELTALCASEMQGVLGTSHVLVDQVRGQTEFDGAADGTALNGLALPNYVQLLFVANESHFNVVEQLEDGGTGGVVALGIADCDTSSPLCAYAGGIRQFLSDNSSQAQWTTAVRYKRNPRAETLVHTVAIQGKPVVFGASIGIDAVCSRSIAEVQNYKHQPAQLYFANSELTFLYPITTVEGTGLAEDTLVFLSQFIRQEGPQSFPDYLIPQVPEEALPVPVIRDEGDLLYTQLGKHTTAWYSMNTTILDRTVMIVSAGVRLQNPVGDPLAKQRTVVAAIYANSIEPDVWIEVLLTIIVPSVAAAIALGLTVYKNKRVPWDTVTKVKEGIEEEEGIGSTQL